MSDHTLTVVKRSSKKEKPASDQLVFGKHYTDHMFIMDYEEGKGWYDPRIVPYEPVTLDPAAMIFHYGQTVFEGLKAYRSKENRILLFRPEKNLQRINTSSERLSIPRIDEEQVLEYLKQLIEIDQDWVPSTPGTSLYIRPFVIATEPNLSLAPSKTYKFMIILSPVGSYYAEGINPVTIKVEEKYTRAVRGGTGAAKTAGNYSSAYKAQEVATKEGFSQVLWLDGVEKKYIEEVGSMNVFFKINGEVVTPQLNGSILEGITRLSTIELLRSWGIPVIERQITIEELFQYHKEGALEEAFGTGTAAVISPIGELSWGEHQVVINHRQTGELAKQLYDKLTGIQTGVEADEYGWTIEV
ncbi:branched-chain amino acid aminotransferase [Desertibacillus haloalkaliphilus]|uniref:branched-chain amino acid aminotransferase n=1 Tax=Desertibacillus haloalkaliphilus TaxID=1328930 RepID=UPI001C27ACA6|nr:branched-chain amino acid aminotransferase [Desertibacillus haloalkaliphilus]MBU8907943.1 branched-chain amino acid aminotransferase [Desertibacillus haloalkaliphilus]